MVQEFNHAFFTKKINRILLVIFFLHGFLSTQSQEVKAHINIEDAQLKLTKQGKQILVGAYIPRGITEFELRIESDRNNPVSGAREISSTDPDPEERALGFQKSLLDVRYPVVDIELESGMDGQWKDLMPFFCCYSNFS